MRIEQVLHGYRAGHRLLAQSTELAPEERRDIDLLSDQSGLLEKGVDYEFYDTLYPTGRWFVVARTWIDREAERRGTVWTHSLLLPTDSVAELTDLTCLHPIFRQPTRPVDGGWSSSVHLPGVTSAPPSLPPATGRAVLGAWFGTDQRPVLAEEGPHSLAYLWARLPPWSRRDFSGCTFAIQPRYLRERLLLWMCPAPKSDSAFQRYRTGPPPQDFPGINFLSGDPAQVQLWWRQHQKILEGASPGQHRVMLRLASLESRQDYSAALARLDCLEALGERGLPLSSAIVDGSLKTLESLPQPGFQELRDLMLRAPHRLAAVEQAERVKERLSRLLQGNLGGNNADLVAMIDAAGRVGLGGLVDASLLDRLKSRSGAELLRELRSLPALARYLEGLLDVHREREFLATHLLKDAALRETVWRWLEDHPQVVLHIAQTGGLEAEDLWRVLRGPATRSILRPLLQAIPVQSLIAAINGLSPENVMQITEYLEELPLATQLQLPTPWYPEIAWNSAAHRPELFRDQPEAAGRLLRQNPRDSRAERLVHFLTREALPEGLCVLFSPEELRTLPWQARWSRAAAPGLTRMGLRGELEIGDLLGWLRLCDDVPEESLQLMVRPPEGALGRAIRVVTFMKTLHRKELLERFWKGWVDMPDAAIAETIPDWTLLMEQLREERLRYGLASLTLARALQGNSAALGGLAVLGFPIVHRALLKKDESISAFPWMDFLAAMMGLTWDKAKPVRRSVVDAIIKQGWKPRTVVDLADGDARTFRWLVELLREEGGKDVIRALRELSLPRDFERALD